MSLLEWVQMAGEISKKAGPYAQRGVALAGTHLRGERVRREVDLREAMMDREKRLQDRDNELRLASEAVIEEKVRNILNSNEGTWLMSNKY